LKAKAASTFGKAFLPALMLVLLPALAALAVSFSDPLLQTLGNELKGQKRPPPDLTNRLGQFLEKNPSNYQAHLLMGDCYVRLGLYDQALAEFKLATQYGPDDPAPISQLIRQQMTVGQNQSTPALLLAAEARFPDDPVIAYLRGNWLLLQRHNVEGAEKLFAKAAAKKAKVPGLHLAMAQVAMARGDYEQAVKQCDEELQLEPDAPEAQLIKGLALSRLRQYVAALAPLKAVYSLTEYKLRPDLARSYAQAAYWNGKFEDAIEPAILQIARTTNAGTNSKDDTLTKNLLAECLRQLPRDTAEMRVTATTNDVDRNASIFKDGSFHRVVGDVLSKVGMDRQALVEYESCLKRNTQDAYALLGAGREFETNFPDYQFALTLYQRARLFRPDIPGIDDLITRLEERIADRDKDLAWRMKDWLHGSYNQVSTEFGALLAGFAEKPKAEDKLQNSKNTR
jgi:tetratricopeptide (TPR) repeat protein